MSHPHGAQYAEDDPGGGTMQHDALLHGYGYVFAAPLAGGPLLEGTIMSNDIQHRTQRCCFGYMFLNRASSVCEGATGSQVDCQQTPAPGIHQPANDRAGQAALE